MATSFLVHPWSWLYQGAGGKRTVERTDKETGKRTREVENGADDIAFHNATIQRVCRTLCELLWIALNWFFFHWAYDSNLILNGEMLSNALIVKKIFLCVINSKFLIGDLFVETSTGKILNNKFCTAFVPFDILLIYNNFSLFHYIKKSFFTWCVTFFYLVCLRIIQYVIFNWYIKCIKYYIFLSIHNANIKLSRYSKLQTIANFSSFMLYIKYINSLKLYQFWSQSYFNLKTHSFVRRQTSNDTHSKVIHIHLTQYKSEFLRWYCDPSK